MEALRNLASLCQAQTYVMPIISHPDSDPGFLGLNVDPGFVLGFFCCETLCHLLGYDAAKLSSVLKVTLLLSNYL